MKKLQMQKKRRGKKFACVTDYNAECIFAYLYVWKLKCKLDIRVMFYFKNVLNVNF